MQKTIRDNSLYSYASSGGWLEESKVTIKNIVYNREYSHRYNSTGVDLKYK